MSAERRAYLIRLAGTPNLSVSRLELAEVLAELTRVEQERDELELGFDLQWEADQRAIAQWQAANPGNDLVWPDRTKLGMWLMERILDLEAQVARLRAERAKYECANQCSGCGGDVYERKTYLDEHDDGCHHGCPHHE